MNRDRELLTPPDCEYAQKAVQRAKIRADLAEYLARGGEIERVGTTRAEDRGTGFNGQYNDAKIARMREKGRKNRSKR